MNVELAKAQFEELMRNCKVLLCTDLEATCNDDNSFPREEMETIEVGIYFLHRGPGGQMVDNPPLEFQRFIKPSIHKVLTPFCTRLTTITQEQIDSEGFSYAEALVETADIQNQLTTRLSNQWLWCSWGAYDKNQLIQDGNFHGLPPLLAPERHFNMKVWFSAMGYGGETKKGMGLGKAVNRLGLNWEGTAHRALDDARNLGNIVKHVTADLFNS